MTERKREKGMATFQGLCSKIKRRLEMAEQIIWWVMLRQRVNNLTMGKRFYTNYLLEELQDLAHDPISNGEEVTLGGAVADSDRPSLNMHEEMTAIPEIETPGRRSKHRAGSVDESSLERAERMKVARNLDFKGFFPRHALASVLDSNGTA
jgi:hypothetical protein